jgi:tripartite ATP-independent transporter DctM subunit
MIMALIGVGSLIVLLFLGVPIVFVTAGWGIIWLVLNGKTFLLDQVPASMFIGLDSFTLLAIPIFVLAGEIMNSSGITDRIFNLAQAIVGHIRGGLAYTNIVASTIFGGISGASMADVAGLGLIEIEAMDKAGYDREFSGALTAASSIQAPLIPPSMPAVTIGGILGISIGGLFVGGLIPGVLIAIACATVTFWRVKTRKYELKGGVTSFSNLFTILWNGLPAIFAPLIIVGGICFGVFSPTEAATVALFYSLIVAFALRTLKLRDLPAILNRAALRAAQIFSTLAGAAVFQWVLSFEGFVTGFTDWSVHIVGNSTFIFLLVMNAIFLFWGMWLPLIVAQLLICPIFYPVALSLGINPIHFGVISIFNLMMGMLTPPVGNVLFATQAVANIKYGKLVREILPFLILDFVLLVLVTFIPQLSLYLPKIFGFID